MGMMENVINQFIPGDGKGNKVHRAIDNSILIYFTYSHVNKCNCHGACYNGF